MAAGDKKYGRNKKDSQRYALEKRADRNKRLRVERHKRAHPKDKTVPGTVPDYRQTHHRQRSTVTRAL